MENDRQMNALIGVFIGLAIGDAMGAPVEFLQPAPQPRFFSAVAPPGYSVTDYPDKAKEAYDRDVASWARLGCPPLRPFHLPELPARVPVPAVDPPVVGYRTGGPHNVRIGEWTDDTAMAVALAEALLREQKFDAFRIMENWLAWYKDGTYGTRSHCFDIGNATHLALSRYASETYDSDYWLPPDRHGAEGPRAAGNGGIMRLAPAVLFAFSQGIDSEARRNLAIELAVKQSHLTHAEAICDEYARRLAALLHSLICTGTEAEATAILGEVFETLPEEARRCPKNSGYVKTTFEAAVWAVATSVCFEESILRAVNLGGDADTIGAVAGQIAGARWGYQAIPQAWRAQLVDHDRLYAVANRLSQA